MKRYYIHSDKAENMEKVLAYAKSLGVTIVPIAKPRFEFGSLIIGLSLFTKKGVI